MVRVALITHLDNEGVLSTGGLAGCNHVVEGGRGVLGKRVVAHQGDGLDGVGNTVCLAIVGNGFESNIREVRRAFAQINGSNNTVGNERTELIVCHHDQVRAITGGDLRGELGVHVSLRLLYDVHSHVRGFGELFRNGLNLSETGVVCPDRKSRRRITALVGSRRVRR